MIKYTVRKLLVSALSLLLIVFILFMLMQLMPGSPFNDEKLSAEQKQVLYEAYGLDKPVIYRFGVYVVNMLKGDFGVSYSISINTPVATLIKDRLPVSMKIGGVAMLFGSLAGMTLGFLAAFNRGKVMDTICMIISILAVSVPSYIFAIVLNYYVGFKWKYLPLLYDYRIPIESSILPVIALSIGVMGVIMKFTRDEATVVLGSDYVLFARSQGIPEKQILLGYVFRNSLIPVITVMAMLLVALLTGSLVTERIFSIPGIGALLTNAISQNDYNVIIALSFVYALLYIVARFILDIVYGLIDPRIRVSGK
ncbi:oligopeptide transport system permease protein [Lachnospiraceae bacterium]|nr:oligopeptide transport system permease protein [Lachnospiraceae bacterium]